MARTRPSSGKPKEPLDLGSVPPFAKVPLHRVRPGHVMISGGQYSTVTNVERFAPGEHPQSPIYNHMPAVKLSTANGGARWFGATENYQPHVYDPRRTREGEEALPVRLTENKGYQFRDRPE